VLKNVREEMTGGRKDEIAGEMGWRQRLKVMVKVSSHGDGCYGVKGHSIQR
jgi:hypothetical protein